jgi:hypothetical protein
MFVLVAVYALGLLIGITFFARRRLDVARDMLIATVNPKNLALTLAAATTIAASGLATGEQIGALAVFILLASLTVAAPVVADLVVGHKADDALSVTKTWLIAHNDAVMAVLFLVFGVKLLGDGITILAG